MTLERVLLEVWRQMMVEGLEQVRVDGRPYRVGRTRSQALRTVAFPYGAELIEGIEQNPQKTSRWAKLAQSGQRIVQFRVRGRYVGNVCEGSLLRYPSWRTLGLPD